MNSGFDSLQSKTIAQGSLIVILIYRPNNLCKKLFGAGCPPIGAGFFGRRPAAMSAMSCLA
jgi:hypothetical protein